MKNILLTISLAVSLILGSTFAFADTDTHKKDESQGSMKAQEMKKGLDEAIVIPNGEDSWVLHQPQENTLQYFSSTSQGEMAGESSGDADSKQG